MVEAITKTSPQALSEAAAAHTSPKQTNGDAAAHDAGDSKQKDGKTGSNSAAPASVLSPSSDASATAGASSSAVDGVNGGGGGGSSNAAGATPSEASTPSASQPPGTLTVRALVSTKEAGIIIGKGGQNVAQLREQTGVKAGVTKVIQGVHDRVLSITGTVEQIAKAFSLVAQNMLDNPPGASLGTPNPPDVATIRLLIAHSLMGTVIGRQGLKIKHIQDTSGVRMVAEKEMLPSSTERIVAVHGSAQGIETAVAEITRCLQEDWERGKGTTWYQPGFDTSGAGVLAMAGEGGLLPQGGRRSLGYAGTAAAAAAAVAATGIYAPQHLVAAASMPPPPQRRAPIFTPSNMTSNAVAVNPGGALTATAQDGSAPIPAQVVDGDMRVQNISIPADMVGCIIGKGGSKITEIRRLSGSRISIAKNPHDESGERMFTIQGTAESNEKALFLLYNSLEGEKERRAAAAAAAAASVAPPQQDAAVNGNTEAAAPVADAAQ